MYFWLVCSVDVWGMGHTAGSCTALFTVVDLMSLQAVLSAHTFLFLFFFFFCMIWISLSQATDFLCSLLCQRGLGLQSQSFCTLFLPPWLNTEQQAQPDMDTTRGQLHECGLRPLQFKLNLNSLVRLVWLLTLLWIYFSVNSQKADKSGNNLSGDASLQLANSFTTVSLVYYWSHQTLSTVLSYSPTTQHQKPVAIGMITLTRHRIFILYLPK